MPSPERLLPLFPLSRVVLFPGMLLPLHVFEERYRLMIGTCQVTDGLFGVSLIRAGREVGPPAEPEPVGCVARILDVERLPDGRMNVLTIGEERFRLSAQPEPTAEGFLRGRARIMLSSESAPVEPRLVAQVRAQLAAYLAALARLGVKESSADEAEIPRDAAALSFRVGSVVRVDARERQRLLEIDDVAERLRAELALLRRELQATQLMLRARRVENTIGPFSAN